MSEKQFLTLQDLYGASIELGRQIIESDFRPNYIVGIWRGGTPVGIAVQEFLDYWGIHTNHISIRTASYKDMSRVEAPVQVYGLNYIIDEVNAGDSLLIVDDVFDTGLSIKAVIDHLHEKMRRNVPTQLRVATAYFKPASNRTDIKPDFYAHATDQWLVFPHELKGLSDEEIRQYKPTVYGVLEQLRAAGANRD